MQGEAMQGEALSSQQFRHTCGKFVTGITIATILGPNGVCHGITVNSFTSVSLEPPLVLICIDYRAQFITGVSAGCCFGINVLQQHQQELSRRFSRHEPDRFSHVASYTGRSGAPLICDGLATMECRLTQIVRAGDHFVLIGEVLYAACCDGEPLVYFEGRYRKLQRDLAATCSQRETAGETDWSMMV